MGESSRSSPPHGRKELQPRTAGSEQRSSTGQVGQTVEESRTPVPTSSQQNGGKPAFDHAESGAETADGKPTLRKRVLEQEQHATAESDKPEQKSHAESKPDTVPSSTSSRRPSALGPPPKKRKSLLGAKLATAAPPRPPKLNTLEKSKLDWESWKQDGAGAEERDEIEAQTKGGGLSKTGRMDGYLHRADFLDRVSDRVEAAEDAQRRSARSRP